MISSDSHSEIAVILETLEIGDELYWQPSRQAIPGAWTGHLATAFWLIKAARPTMFVELGTHSGNSYSAFCQAIAQMGLPTRTFAVDTWLGDEHAGLYGEEVFRALQAFNESHFGEFSKLLRTTFDEARRYFPDNCIDLLHIDGLHTYEAVKHDFDTWKSALSANAVVVFHDTNVRERGFGVWKLWQELSETYPSFEFHHSEGLGIVGVGPNQPRLLRRLFELAHDPHSAAMVRRIFASRGQAFLSRSQVLDLTDRSNALSRELQAQSHRVSALEQDVASRDAALRDRIQEIWNNGELIRTLQQEVVSREATLADREQEVRAKAELINNLRQELATRDATIRERDEEIQQTKAATEEHAARLQAQMKATESLNRERSASSERIQLLQQELADVRQTLGLIESSTAWKLASGLRSAFHDYPKLRSYARRIARIIWWTVTFQLVDRLRARRRLFQTRDLIANSQLFDAAWYLSQYPDVAEAGCDPALHYALFGATENRDPSPFFCSRLYLAQNPDVRAAGENPLIHYIQSGKAADGKSKSGGDGRPNVDRHTPGLTLATQDNFRKFADALYERERGKKGWNTEYVLRSTDNLDSSKLDIKAVAFYLPQFHPIPENDVWWGKNFTEWRNVTRAVPQFLGHYQPRLPGDLGFYDLRVPEVMKEQVQIAKLYGIHGFCFYYYWFGGKRLLQEPLDRFLAAQSLDLNFCVCWANENWTRRWDGLEKEILISQEHSPEDDVAFIHSLLPFFRDPRYIRIGNRPLLLIYHLALLPEPRATVARWRDAARNNGFDDLYIAAVLSFDMDNPAEYGVDGAVEFPPHQTSPIDIKASQSIINQSFSGCVYDYPELAARYGKTQWPSRTFKTVFPSWDNSARRGPEGHIFQGSQPAVYAKWLRDACQVTSRYPADERILFINAWNEWAEGAYLEPDARYGYAYLHTTASVLRYYYRNEEVAGLVELNNSRFTKKSDMAVVLHAYHEDLVSEIVDRYLIHHQGGADVFITLRPDASVDCVKYLLSRLGNTVLLLEENRGRDIRPFLHVLRRLRDLGYASVCKIHTKLSPHRVDGDQWRDLLVASLLGHDQAVTRARQRFESDPNLGLLVPRGSMIDLSIEEVNAGNRVWLDRLLPKMGCSDLIGSYRTLFPAGSMYWFRVAALAGLDDLALEEDAFELEAGQLDGTLAHAIERLVVLYASIGGYGVEEFDATGIPIGTKALSFAAERDIPRLT